jgi:magnesium-transporting ATPase (P-type)
MIVVTYASGTADLGRLGALVHRARSVESLAESSVICFAQAGILTGTHVEIEMATPPEGREALSESRLRQVMGDFARTSRSDSLAVRAIGETFEGSQRVPVEEAPFLSVYGWSAITFDDDDLRGVYVLAEPEILEAHLAAQETEPEANGDEDAPGAPIGAVGRVVAPLGRLFGRSRKEADESSAARVKLEPSEDDASQAAFEDRDTQAVSLHAGLERSPDENPMGNGRDSHAFESATTLKATMQPEVVEDVEGTSVRGFLRGLSNRVSTVLRRGDSDQDTGDASEEDQVEETNLSFAYLPGLAPIHDAGGTPHLPDGLTPLCTLHYSQRMRPESVEMVRTFVDTGVEVKVFSTETPERMVRLVRQAGLGSDKDFGLASISGPELAKLDAREFAKAVNETSIFGLVTPEQAGLVVAALRKAGEAVAVVGDSVGDLPPMRQADLAISRKSSTQAALSLADIILLEDSPRVLGVVLAKGQRIVNGLMDILKLQLTQVFYVAFLLATVALFARGYPYRSGQGTVIMVTTVAIPSLGLTLGAAAGVLPSARLSRLLFRLVVPASLTIGTAAFLVYLLFLDRSGQIAYAQLGVTYTLVACGLGMVIFVKPPRPAAWSGGATQGAWWPVALALALMALFVGVCAIPLAQELLHVDLLQEPTDYAIVALAVLAWAVTLRFLLFLIPVARSELRL